MNNTYYSLLIILVISLVTILERIGPTWFFPPEKSTPKVLIYLSKVMPMAIIGMLVVYCFKDVKPLTFPYGLPELIASGITVLTFLIKRSTIMSILLGTLSYMFLVQFVFQ